MATIHQFPRYTVKENFVTNNSMLLLGRVYQTDPALFQKYLSNVLESDALQIGPAFSQQTGAGGIGIPDAMIVQKSFKIVLEAKLHDNNFWGKQEYTSHFNNEETRILITLSKQKISAERDVYFKTELANFDREMQAKGNTIHKHITYIELITSLRKVIEVSRTRFKIELEELIDDYEGFIADLGLIDDVHLRMHVVPVGDTYPGNLEHKLYYNSTSVNHSPHKFIGLYYKKKIRHIGEIKTVLIPHRSKEGNTITYTFQKGKEHFTQERKVRFEQFLKDFVAQVGYGDEGKLRFHLFDEWHNTQFRKESSGGIMGPRHCYLPYYIKEGLTSESGADFVAQKLNNEIWEVG